MYKFLLGSVCGLFAIMGFTMGQANANNVLATDTSDPLYMLAIEEILSESSLIYSDNVLRAGQTVSYGLNNRLTLGGNVHFQEDFNGSQDGFSSIDLGGVYRAADGSSDNSNIIYDILFGMKFGGSSHVRTPYFADSTFYAGLRMGRQWAGVTLAATLQSNWVFDDVNGMAYIDFMPEAYFRINPDWRLGANLLFRKATDSKYDQEWIGGKIVRQFGRTQYTGHIDYEFESDDVLVGAKLNILF